MVMCWQLLVAVLLVLALLEAASTSVPYVMPFCETKRLRSHVHQYHKKTVFIMLQIDWQAHERHKYCNVPSMCPLPGKCPCTAFQGVTVVASIQMYGIYILGKHPCGPKQWVTFKHPWALTRDTTVLHFVVNTASAHVHNLAHYVHVASTLQHTRNVHYGALDLVLSSATSKDWSCKYLLC